jgi:uncharacterized protein (DUF305 family)
MSSRALLSLFLLALLVQPLSVLAQQSMQGMNMPAPVAGTDSSAAFKAANDKMMKGMDVPLTGDADRDFVAGMIPHHTGAVDMAEVELKYGKDPAMRKLAQDVIAAQRKEIAVMKKWQAAHAK